MPRTDPTVTDGGGGDGQQAGGGDVTSSPGPQASIHRIRQDQSLTGSGRLIISSIRDSATHLVEAVEFGALGGGSGRSTTLSATSGGGAGGAELVDDRPLASRLGGFTNSYRNIASLQAQAKQNQLINEATALVEKGEATAEVCCF